MAEANGLPALDLKEILPKTGLVYNDPTTPLVLCKPKLMPMKSVTLEKLEKMQKEAQETVKLQEFEEEKKRALSIVTQEGEFD
ncbi:BBSome-interacting protein 1-like [Corticium candelabrum]|uniref:BBSome-interacting protein 1-like n=1 Tax=Corticium candelabrum TaxID=121492 RepID=UPI002E25F5AC|nr:BBSome-interacting protein 1-like [Corticium candelabrum]